MAAGAAAGTATVGLVAGYFLGRALVNASARDTWDVRRANISTAIAQARRAAVDQLGRPLLAAEFKVLNDRRAREIAEIDRLERISHTGGLATYGKVG